MRPGGVRAHQHHQIAVFHVLIAARHHVGAKGALISGHRRGHTEPGIGIDIGGADKSLHQFIRRVVVLGEQLSGGVKRHRLRPVLLNDLPQPATGNRQRP